MFRKVVAEEPISKNRKISDKKLRTNKLKKEKVTKEIAPKAKKMKY